ncbi:hypothetical protein [Ekhidna sp.]|uniref:hypothetical protein n=1 Tax=Ekhidna sp. TaxID=2608089 RepID=UPI003C7A76D4
MRYLLLFAILFISLHVTSQVKVDSKATGRHADAINQAKGAKQTAKQRREQARKLQQQVKAKALYRQKYDSIKNGRLTDRRYDSLSVDSLNYVDISLDSLAVFTQEDSLQVAEQILNETDFPPEYRELILNPIELEKELNTDQADSIALAKATAILNEEAKKFMPDEMGNAEDPITQLSDPTEGVNPIQKSYKPNPNLVKPDKARELFKKVDPEQFQDAQADIQKMKKKYSELPDTRYPEEGTKRNSLEDIPFKQRLYFGGNISLQSTDPLILSTNLQLGYWINKKWLAGVGLTLREQFTAEDSTSLTTGDGHGYSLFTRYDIPKGFFTWAESEWQIDKSLFGNEQPASKGWQRAHLLGIGREFKIGIVQMMSMIMYDFNYQNNDLNSRPWVFRLGVRFSKKPG